MPSRRRSDLCSPRRSCNPGSPWCISNCRRPRRSRQPSFP
jgi:hypothetical protein